MEINDIVGIDVSKLTIDVVIYKSKSYRKLKNSTKGFKELIKWVLSHSKEKKEDMLFVFEHTGLYSHQLSVFLSENEFNFTIVPGLEIKRSLGIARGKDDKIDAAKIARYAYRLRDEIQPTRLPSVDMQVLKDLLRLRERMVRQKAGYITHLNEIKGILKKKDNAVLFTTQQSMVNSLEKQIEKIEYQIDNIITKNSLLNRQFNLLKSIKGIGRQTALYMIITTAAFTRFKSSRQYAAYCGVAPFPNSSGTSINGRTKVSHLANKKVKAVLDMAAMSAIRNNPEMRIYYQRKVNDGKNKRSIINAVKNKLLARMFAVIKRDSLYINISNYAA